MCVGGRHDDLPAILARVARACDKPLTRFHTVERLQRQRGFAVFRIDTGRGQFTCVGALHGKHRQFGPFNDFNVERPGMLTNPRKVLFARRRIDDNAVVGIANVIDDQVIDDATIRVKHAGIQRLAIVLELGNVIGNKELQEVPSALTCEIDDRHVRHVEDPGILPYGKVLFFLRTIVQRHIPATEIDDACTGFNVLVVMRSLCAH